MIPPFHRRDFLKHFGAAALTAFAGGCATGRGASRDAPRIAITIDDFDIQDTPLLSGEARHRALLAALDRFGVKAAGFPAGKMVDSEAGARYLRSWSAAGHILGNHSYSHGRLERLDAPEATADILRCESLLTPYPTFRKLFRFPYLAEGATRESRDRLREVLRANGYRNAHVTIDTSDWYLNSRLIKKLRAEPGADLGPYRRYYLDHLWERASFYDGLARALLDRPVTHTLLLHHNLAAGLFLGDALQMFREKGWGPVDSARAFDQPLFAASPDVVPAGQSLIWSLAKARGGFEERLRFPGESDNYEKPAMDRLGL